MSAAEMSNANDEIEGVAIVGMSVRFPGADNKDEFWRNLRDGVESVTFFSTEELLEAKANPVELSLPGYVKAAPILKNIDQFDAGFFNIPPSEAELLDPQHRFFLECSWEALEDAGYDPESYKGWIGVFSGVGSNGYFLNNLWSNRDFLGTLGNITVMTSSERDYIATRVAYKFNLRGPGVNVQTACSTSLVATHLACQSLLNYQCDMALAGGATIRIPQVGYLYTDGGIESPDGHCRPFDAKAQGTVFGSGAGVVVLKRLSDALEQGDRIYAVIRGSAINNDGSAKAGYTAPGVKGQAQVIAMAHVAANVDPATISYLEAHSTGTVLGDPIEVEALTQAFRTHTDKKQFCAIGSVKANIGHMDSAAGVASLIKATLALQHRQLLPSVNFDAPNPNIDFANSPFYVSTELREWRSDGKPRRAGVSSFGIGGTNAHAILEEAPSIEPSDESRRYQLLVLSARTETALDRVTDNLVAHLQATPGLKLADAAFTLQVGRHAFEKRRMVVCESSADAVAALQARDPARVLTGMQVKLDRRVVFMFSGQGAQYVNMGRDLYEREALFREQVDTCSELLRPHLGLDLREVLYPTEAAAGQAAGRLDQTWLTQPALFVIEYALARLWMAWGIKPQAMIGHSIGEYVAACLAEVFALQDALALVAARGRLMQSMPPGSMLSVPLSETDVQPWLTAGVSVATVNGPSSCVVAGPTEAIVTLEQRLADGGIGGRRLHTSHAFHSAMMESILEPFKAQVRQVRLSRPRLRYISNVTGAWIKPEEATDPAYWAQHLRQAVRFSEGIYELAQTPDHVLLEVGPGNTLRTLAQRHPDRALDQVVLASMPHPQETRDDQAHLLHTLGQLWLAGVPVDWQALYHDERRLRVALPTYPFERKRYWIEPGKSSSQSALLFKNPNIADWFYVPSWKRSMPPVWEPPAQESRWLVFSAGDHLSKRLLKHLCEQGCQVATVLAGEQFAANGQTYAVRPAHRADYDALLKSLKEHDQLPTHIVHLWNVTPLDEGVADFTEIALQRSFYSLLFLAQAIGSQDLKDNLRLAVVSSNMHQVAGEETVYPEKATLLGPCKVIPQEMPNVACCSIDIVLPKAASSQEAQLVEQIVAELEADAPGSIIAYRGCDRWVQVYEPAPLAEAKDKLDRRLREQGVYLITGGLGGIGLTLTEYLVHSVQAKIVLTSRTRFPERANWEHWLVTHDPQDRTSARIRTLQALEASGAEIMVLQADVADREQMEAVVRAACERFGAIHGVIHTAGLPGGGVIQLKTEPVAASVLRPKVQGTRVLEAVLRDIPLDFMVLWSSITATTGGFGQVDYTAANAFMDAYAHAYAGCDGALVMSLNWDAWGEVGMAVNTPPNYAATRPQQAVVERAVDHPLLVTARDETDKQTVYQAELSPAKDWVLSEHVLMGIPTVPGSTHLELARAAFTDRTHGSQLQFHEVIFLVPLMVSYGDSKETQLVLEERAGEFDFRVVSKAGVAANGEPRWQTHAIGQLGRLTDATPQQYDVQAILARCNISEIGATAENADATEGFLTFGPRWRTFKGGYIGHDEGIARIELDQDFYSDLESFKLHPALLDAATSMVMGLARDARYLPLSYKHAHVYNSLPARLYSYVRLRPGSVIGGETISVQVAIMDEQGCCVMDVDEFTLRRVEEAAAARLRGSVEGDTTDASEAQRPVEQAYQRDLSRAILPPEGIEVFRRILFRNRLPQVVISTQHLPTLIEQVNQFTQDRLLETVVSAGGAGTKHQRANLKTPFVAPRNEVETRLAAIWQELLRIDQVGVYDNFFELGGDSVMGIQIVAQVRAAGFQVDPGQLFQHQTIAELASALQPTFAGGDTAGLPLTPRQRHWLERSVHEPYIVVLEPEHRLDMGLVEQALELVRAQHDALRLRFDPVEKGWRQALDDQPPASAVVKVDLAGLPADERDEAIGAEIMRLRHGFESVKPPLLRAVYLRSGTDHPDCLLLAVTPLSADAAALPVLLEDLHTAYQQMARATDGQLLAPTAAFADWSRRLAEYGQSGELQTQKDYWRRMAGQPVPSLPIDVQRDKTKGNMAQLSPASLSPEQTRQLQELTRSYVQPDEVILTALAQVVIRWSGHTSLLVGLCHYQRGVVLGDLDTSRTVGCLRTDYPLYLDLPATDDLDAALRAIKEHVRGVPRQGLGYSHLCASDAALAMQPSITFLYRPPLPNYALFHLVQVFAPGEDWGQIHLSAGIVNGRLWLDWRYDSDLYSRETMQRLNDGLVSTLQTLIQHCYESGAPQLTPADFPEAGLDQAALDRLILKLNKKG